MDSVLVAIVWALIIHCVGSMPVKRPSCVVDESVFQLEFEREKINGRWFIDHGANMTSAGKWRAESFVLDANGTVHFLNREGHLDVEGTLDHHNDRPPSEFVYHDDTHSTVIRVVVTDYNTAIIYEKLTSETDDLGTVGDSQIYYLSRKRHLTDEQRRKLYDNDLQTALCLHQEKSCDVQSFPVQENFDMAKITDVGKWFIVQEGNLTGKWRADHVVFTPDENGEIQVSFHDGGITNTKHAVKISRDKHRHIDGNLKEDSQPGDYVYMDKYHSTQMRFIWTDYETALVYEKLLSEKSGEHKIGGAAVYWISKITELSNGNIHAVEGPTEELYKFLCIDDKDTECNPNVTMIQENFDIEKFMTGEKWYIVKEEGVHRVGKWRADHVVFTRNDEGLIDMSFHDGGLLHDDDAEEQEHKHKDGHFAVGQQPGDYHYVDSTHSTHMRFVWTDYSSALVYEQLLSEANGSRLLANVGDGAVYHLSKTVRVPEEESKTVGEVKDQLYPQLCLKRTQKSNGHQVPTLETSNTGKCNASNQVAGNFTMHKFVGRWYIAHDNQVTPGKWRADHIMIAEKQDGIHIHFRDGPFDTEHYITGRLTEESSGKYMYSDDTHSTHLRVVWTDYNTALVYEQLVSNSDGIGQPGNSNAYFIHRERELSNDEQQKRKELWSNLAPHLCLTSDIHAPPKETCEPSDRKQDDFEMEKFTGKWYIYHGNFVHVGKWRADHLLVEQEENGTYIEFQDGLLDKAHYVKGTLTLKSAAEYIYSDSTHTSHIRILWTNYNFGLLYERLVNAHDGLGSYGDSDAYIIHRKRDLSAEEIAKIKSSWTKIVPTMCLTHHEETMEHKTCKPSDRAQEGFDLNKFAGKWYIYQGKRVHEGKWLADHLLIEHKENGIHIEFQDGPLKKSHYVKGTLTQKSTAKYEYVDDSHTTQFRIVWTDYNFALIYESVIITRDGMGSFGDSNAYFIHRKRDLSAQEVTQMKSSWDSIVPALCLTPHQETKERKMCKPSDRAQEGFNIAKFTGKWYIHQGTHLHVGKWRAEYLIIDHGKNGTHIEFHDGHLDKAKYVKGVLTPKSTAKYEYSDESHSTHFRIVWTDYNFALIYERLRVAHDGLGSYGDSDAYFIHRHRNLSADESARMMSSWDRLVPGLCLTRHQETDSPKMCKPSDTVQEGFEMGKFTGKWYIAHEKHVHVGKWRSDHLLIQPREDGIHIEFHKGTIYSEHSGLFVDTGIRTERGRDRDNVGECDVYGMLTQESPGIFVYSDGTHSTHFRVVWTDYNIALVYERLISSQDGIGRPGDSDAYFIHKHRELSKEEDVSMEVVWSSIVSKLCLTSQKYKAPKEKCVVNQRVAPNFDIHKFVGKWYIDQETRVHVGKWRADHLVIKETERGVGIEFHGGPFDQGHYVKGNLTEQSQAVFTYSDASHTTHFRVVWTTSNLALIYERLISSDDRLGSHGNSDAYFIHRHPKLSAKERQLMDESWVDIIPKLCLTKYQHIPKEGSGESASSGDGSGETGPSFSSGDVSSGELDRSASVEGSGVGSGDVGSGSVHKLTENSGDDSTMETCTTRRDRINERIQKGSESDTDALDQNVPVCEQDGSYSAKQCRGSRCFCVSPDGKEIENFLGVDRRSSDHLTCGCAREHYSQMTAGNDHPTVHCDNVGNYHQVQCKEGACFCADPSSGAPVEGTQLPEAEKKKLEVKCVMEKKQTMMPSEAKEGPH